MIASMDEAAKEAPLVAHVIHRLGTGGMENGLINLINHMSPDRYRHAVICLSGYSDFRQRIERPEVPVIALHGSAAPDWRVWRRLWLALRELRPDVLHTRNLRPLRAQAVAVLAGVRVRIHGEHAGDLTKNSTRSKSVLIRKMMRPFVHHYVTVNAQLEQWLVSTIGAPVDRVSRIPNGVDTGKFQPRAGPLSRLAGPAGFVPQDGFVIGTVGRLNPVKAPLNLVRAFRLVLDQEPELRSRLRLVFVGAGRMRQQCVEAIRKAQLEQAVWLAGDRSDVPELLRGFDLFVLPSLVEGLPNAILEAMASGLPVVATAVGGLLEIVEPGVTGLLVPPGDPAGLAQAIRTYLHDPQLAARHGSAARARVEQHFRLESMVASYAALYDAARSRRKY